MGEGEGVCYNNIPLSLEEAVDFLGWGL